MRKSIKLFTVLTFLISTIMFGKEIKNKDFKNQVEITLVVRNGKKSVVTEEEYNKASDFGKKND